MQIGVHISEIFNCYDTDDESVLKAKAWINEAIYAYRNKQATNENCIYLFERIREKALELRFCPQTPARDELIDQCDDRLKTLRNHIDIERERQLKWQERKMIEQQERKTQDELSNDNFNFTRKELERMSYEKLFAVMKASDVFPTLWTKKDDRGFISVAVNEDRNGNKVWYSQLDDKNRRFGFIVGEGISRLLARQHIKQYSQEFCNSAELVPTEIGDHFDYSVGDKRIEVKCGGSQYTFKYFKEHGVMVDANKEDEANVLYERSFDDYGLFFNMTDAYSTDERVSKNNTEEFDGRLAKRTRIYFNVEDAIVVYDKEGNEYHEKY